MNYPPNFRPKPGEWFARLDAQIVVGPLPNIGPLPPIAEQVKPEVRQQIVTNYLEAALKVILAQIVKLLEPIGAHIYFDTNKVVFGTTVSPEDVEQLKEQKAEHDKTNHQPDENTIRAALTASLLKHDPEIH